MHRLNDYSNPATQEGYISLPGKHQALLYKEMLLDGLRINRAVNYILNLRGSKPKAQHIQWWVDQWQENHGTGKTYSDLINYILNNATGEENEILRQVAYSDAGVRKKAKLSYTPVQESTHPENGSELINTSQDFELLRQSINNLHLGARSHNLLRAWNIEFLWQLITRFDDTSILNIPNMGKKSRYDIQECLKIFGLSLGTSLDAEILKKLRTNL